MKLSDIEIYFKVTWVSCQSYFICYVLETERYPNNLGRHGSLFLRNLIEISLHTRQRLILTFTHQKWCPFSRSDLISICTGEHLLYSCYIPCD